MRQCQCGGIVDRYELVGGERMKCRECGRITDLGKIACNQDDDAAYFQPSLLDRMTEHEPLLMRSAPQTGEGGLAPERSSKGFCASQPVRAQGGAANGLYGLNPENTGTDPKGYAAQPVCEGLHKPVGQSGENGQLAIESQRQACHGHLTLEDAGGGQNTTVHPCQAYGEAE